MSQLTVTICSLLGLGLGIRILNTSVILSYHQKKSSCITALKMQSKAKHFNGVYISIADPTSRKISCIYRYANCSKHLFLADDFFQIKRRGIKPSKISPHSCRIQTVRTPLTMKWTNYGREFSTVRFNQKTNIDGDFDDGCLSRFLDVGQSIGSASPRVRACEHSLECRKQHCLF